MVKFSCSSISPFTLPFVIRIMERKEGYYSLSPQHMVKSCTDTHPLRLLVHISKTWLRGLLIALYFLLRKRSNLLQYVWCQQCTKLFLLLHYLSHFLQSAYVPMSEHLFIGLYCLLPFGKNQLFWLHLRS